LSTLPNLLKTSEDRRVTLDVLARLESQIEANPQQIQLLGEIRHVLAKGGSGNEASSGPITVSKLEDAPAIRSAVLERRGSADRARENRNARSRA
jgi:hypothetical protein